MEQWQAFNEVGARAASDGVSAISKTLKVVPEISGHFRPHPRCDTQKFGGIWAAIIGCT
jgi:hypothetical protein